MPYFYLQNRAGEKFKTTMGNAEADKLIYFKNRVQDFWHGIQLGKFRNIDDLIASSQELLNLSEDMDLLAEMREWRSTEKKLGYIKGEFGYDVNAWNYARNAFGDKGSLKSTEKLEINRDIAQNCSYSHSFVSNASCKWKKGAMEFPTGTKRNQYECRMGLEYGTARYTRFKVGLQKLTYTSFMLRMWKSKSCKERMPILGWEHNE